MTATIPAECLRCHKGAEEKWLPTREEAAEHEKVCKKGRAS